MIARVALVMMAAFYVVAGLNHFRDPDFYLQIMPPWVPWHEAMVWLSGVAEVALGIALLVPRTRRWAAWGVVALLIAVFPANLHMALNDVPINGEHLPAWALWLRLPLQLVLIGWALVYTRGPRAETERIA
jgi:uncharacterized membrane protein